MEVSGTGIVSKFSKCFSEFFLHQHVSKPIFRKASGEEVHTLDLLISECSDRIIDVETCEPLGTTRQAYLFLTFSIVTTNGNLRSFCGRKFNFQKADFVGLNSVFSNINWSNVLDGKDVQDCYSTLCSNYIKFCDAFITKNLHGLVKDVHQSQLKSYLIW